MTPRLRQAWILLGLGTLLAGCGGNQNTVAPASHPERSVADVFWVMLGVSCVGFGVIVTLLFLGWARRDRPSLPGGGGERAATRVVMGLGVALPIVLLVSLFIWSDLFVLRSVAAPTGRTPMTVRVTGHQWWWEVRYPGSGVVTANEIHIPVETKVTALVTTDDVIHSFWVPELNRKVDMIPGVTNRLLLLADKPGVFRGQCAEFCGLQHAHMSVEVIAEPRPMFDAWLARNAKPAPRTNALFTRNCSGCHQIRGTSAKADVGPDLTHFASRRSIAALTLPNTPANLRDWLRDPQHVKPGNRMPDLPLKQPQWVALQRYLESLR
jgi:cytochrome c oxidase subunit II